MTARFADTSYYVALVNPHDEHHEAAQVLTEQLEGSIITTDWVLTELGNFLCKGKNRLLFLSLLTDLRDDPSVLIISFDQSYYELGLDLFARRPDKDWSLTDCVSFVVMERQHLHEALTTDHHFEQAGFRKLL
jgi:predicted nucleic acid-binding protein